MKFIYSSFSALFLLSLANCQTPKVRYWHMLPCELANSVQQDQLKEFIQDTNGQTETSDNAVQDNTTNSLRAGPRGYVLLEDTVARKKLIHFDHERQPERVVHALGHAAYGSFQANGDWSNVTSACMFQNNTVTDTFTRFSVVVAGVGGSESGRDTHGFATKFYGGCGNLDFVGNHLSSFFINDGIMFPDLIHAVKAEPDKGFPTGMYIFIDSREDTKI